MMRLLFTCMGTSDPVRGYHDGPMLHIIRHYRPEVICVFLSGEAAALDGCGARLDTVLSHAQNNWGGYSPELRVVRTQIEDPSDMDAVGAPITEAVAALNRMLDDFSAYQGGKKTLIILEGLRSYEEQQEILNEKIAALGAEQTIAQTPGASEHHTGYAMDMDLYIDGVISTFVGEGDYAWIYENAHKYGFVLRYAEGKESITGISPESWHFRYVGVPHAEYMYKNNLSLEEYIDTLALYPFESAHLSVSDEATGSLYEIYSVAVNADGTQVPVPVSADMYTLSGDNSGHVIVTVKKA